MTSDEELLVTAISAISISNLENRYSHRDSAKILELK